MPLAENLPVKVGDLIVRNFRSGPLSRTLCGRDFRRGLTGHLASLAIAGAGSIR
jgi:hypothetical protein